MDDKDAVIAALKHNALTLGVMMFGFRNLSVALMRRARKGLPIDGAAIQSLRDECLLEVKNSEIIGLPIKDEANAIRQSIENLEKFLDSAIAEARKD